MRLSRSFVRRSSLLAACVLALGAGPAQAKDESKIQIRMEPLVDANDVGRVMSFMWDGRARLDLHVRRLAPSTEHVLKLDDGTELMRFTTSTEGNANVRVDLLGMGTSSAPPVDPRGHELLVADPIGDVLSGWLYGAAEDDPHWVHIKEWTELDPSDLADPPPAPDVVVEEDDDTDPGRVLARYELNPSGKPRFRVQARHIVPGDYDVYVNSVLVASFTPNAAGNAEVDFRTNGKAYAAMTKFGSNGKPKHNQKLLLAFDPRDQLIELKQGADVYYSGIMRAGIDGVNECEAGAGELAMTPADPASTATGKVEVGNDDGCDRELEVEVEGLLAGSYDVMVDGVVVGQIVVAVDGESSSIEFETDPDEAGELPLTFAFGDGSVIDVGQAGTVLLSVTLP
jgi:hypothetical protein